jgi:molybdopterin-guanine dinucleotide biosynthesis protein A
VTDKPGMAAWTDREQVTGVILAGGKATRMGGVDKGLVALNDRPMIAYVIDALRPQVAEILINANRSHDAYGEFGHRLIADAEGDFKGPLAGFASGMQAAQTPFVAFVPCDSPLVGDDLVRRLHAGMVAAGARIAVAHDGERLQPVFALIDCTLQDDLAGYLDGGGRKIDQWYARHGFATVDCSDVAESFRNINAPGDKQALEAELASRSGA